MNAQILASEARDSTNEFLGVLSVAILRQLQLAFVARWLSKQDETVLSAAAVTACDAITLLDTRP